MIGVGAGGAVWPNVTVASDAQQTLRLIARSHFITMSVMRAL